MKRLFLFLLPALALPQTAKYPNSVVTSAQLMNLANRVQTNLSVAANATDTTLHVVSAARVQTPGLVTVDSEIVAVCDKSGNDLIVGFSACPNADGRGFDSTSAASHSLNAATTMYVDAWHHNAVSAEIQAIETFLGVNGANIVRSFNSRQGAVTPQANDYTWSQIGGTKQGNTNTPQMAGANSGSAGAVLCNDASGNATTSGCSTFSLPTVNASDYAFPAQTCNGSNSCSVGGSNGAVLVNGVGATLTLNPCPVGLAGADTNHYLYISGGVGTAEGVLITGGTCTSGATSGTIAFTPGQGHSGSWTIGPDSGGVREAILANPNGAEVLIAPNTAILVSKPVVVDVANIEIRGSGWSSVIKARDNAALNPLLYGLYGSSANLTVRDLGLDGNRANSGTAQSTAALLYIGDSHARVYNLEVKNSQFLGIYVEHDTSDTEIRGCWIHANGNTLGSGTNPGGSGIRSSFAGGTNRSADIRITGNRIESNYNTVSAPDSNSVGIALDSTDVLISQNWLKDNYNLSGGQITNLGSAGVSRNWRIENNRIYRSGSFGGDATSGVEYAASGVTITGNIITGHTNGGGIVIEAVGDGGAGDATISGNYITGAVGIDLLDAGGGTGIVRGTTIASNRIVATTGLLASSTTVNTTLTGNDFTDSGTPITLNGSVAAMTANLPYTTIQNVPLAATAYAVGGTIASAGTIAPTAAFTLVSGTTTISTITAPGLIATYGGTLTLLATAAWATDTAGNIAAAITAAAGHAYSFWYDPASLKWYVLN